jgi:hypothetical protein
MRRLLTSLAVLAVVGVGCVSQPAVPEGTTLYENEQYGFAFAYPPNLEARVRDEELRQTQYLGLKVDFFLSLRDTVRDKKPTNIAWFYAAPGLTTDGFKASLEASDTNGAVKVTAMESVKINNLELTKVTSTTEIGTDKYHYLFDGNGTTVIISVFVAEETAFDPVLQTIRKQ